MQKMSYLGHWKFGFGKLHKNRTERVWWMTGKSCMQCGSHRSSNTFIYLPHFMCSHWLYHRLQQCTGPSVTNFLTTPTPSPSFPAPAGATPASFSCSFIRSTLFIFCSPPLANSLISLKIGIRYTNYSYSYYIWQLRIQEISHI